MINFFSIFDISVNCEIDTNILREKYFELQKKYHPDYSKDPKIDIAIINKGYEVLTNQLQRLKHILEINNISFSETITDTEFLIKCIEWQENKSISVKEIEQKIEAELNETVKLINLQNFILANSHLQKALYLNKLKP